MPTRELLEQEYNKLKEELLLNLGKIIACPSVYDASTIAPHIPFGKGIDSCLDTTLKICDELGLKTFKDPSGYYGYAEIGEGKELVGVLCHLDVVPVDDGEEWYDSPFKLIQKDEQLIARGVADDKGPTMVALYALKALMNLNFTFSKRIRFIFGTDEERLWQCIYKYIENEEIPQQGITPDSSFPVIYAEKGLLQFTIEGSGEAITLKGGGAFNVVPSSIIYTGEKQEELAKELSRLNYAHTQNTDNITVQGKTAHAADVENGINPISRLMTALYNIGYHSPCVDFVAEYIKESPYGEHLFGIIEDEDSGKLKTNLASVNIDEDNAVLSFDFRIPVNTNIEALVSKLEGITTPYGLRYRFYDSAPSLYIPKDSELIKNLCAIYHEVTGLDTTPLAIGGATYSRAMQNFVSYGMLFPDSGHSSHQKNEYLRLRDIEPAFIIYSKALAYLGQKIEKQIIHDL